MEGYNKSLKYPARKLRRNMTDAEQKLWQQLRCKQIYGRPFYRQKPIQNFIVDFYCAAAKLVIEIDGGQHFENDHQCRDKQRDKALQSLGLKVLRFDNRQVLCEMGSVLEVIYQQVVERS